MEIPYTVKARPDTGLWNAKIGVWLFLASEVMLFGGLFSAYIFLRLAPEGPWPVQVLTVSWGFWNTLILILSSVTVLQAWVALKLRKYGLYQVWMALTIICAFAFLGIKSVEYNDKFHHYGVRLHDGSVMEGHLPHEKDGSHGKYRIRFENVQRVTLASRPMDMGLFDWSFFHNGSDGEFLKHIVKADSSLSMPEDTEPKKKPSAKFKLPNGEVKELDEDGIHKLMDEARSKKNKDANGKWAPVATITLEAVEPLTLEIPAGKLFDNAWRKGKPAPAGGEKKLENFDSANFRDGTVVYGDLVRDDVILDVDKLDFRWLFPHDEKDEEKAFNAALNAELWKHMGAELKEKFKVHRAAHLKHFHEIHDGKDVIPNPMSNDDYVRKTYSVLYKELNSYKVDGSAPTEPAKHSSVEKGAKVSNLAAAGGHGDADAAHGGGDHAYPRIPVPHKEVAHFSNFTPKWNNYYAIYFCITGLHGLHVLAGALVLSYFLLFGKKLYMKDPEHMANRVEVGGLFWHFVDLVWIFLFPLLYLL